MSTTAPVKQGDILAGKYQIERVLGEGGMGIVVAALHLQLDQRVAIKFLLPEAMANPEVVARFSREARAAAKIQSPHVARVIDVGQLENGSPYMVMEYLEGKDLSLALQEHGQLPWDDVVRYVLQGCEAIAEAHAAGIIHRDLKPANLFLAKRADGSLSVKVLDFGISKAVDPNGPEGGLTHTRTMMGSPHYMSPEQMTSARNVDARTDIWSMGVIMYELLSGKTPFDGETMPEIVAAILQNKPAPLREARPDVPEKLQQIIDICMSSDVAMRFGNVGELAAALAEIGTDVDKASATRISRVLGTAGIKVRPSLVDDERAGPRASDPSIVRHTPSNPQTAVGGKSGASTQLGGTAFGNTGSDLAQSKARSKVPLFIGAAVIVLGLGSAAAVARMNAHSEAVVDPAASHTGEPEPARHAATADKPTAENTPPPPPVDTGEPEAPPTPTTAHKAPSTVKHPSSQPTGKPHTHVATHATTKPTAPTGSAPAPTTTRSSIRENLEKMNKLK